MCPAPDWPSFSLSLPQDGTIEAPLVLARRNLYAALPDLLLFPDRAH